MSSILYKPILEDSRFPLISKIINNGKKTSFASKSRRERQTFLRRDKEAKLFYNWIFSIAKSLGLYKVRRNLYKDDAKFGDILGVCSSTIKHYRLRMGFLPSQKIYKRLLEIERTLNNNKANIKEETYIVSDHRTLIFQDSLNNKIWSEPFTVEKETELIKDANL